MTLDEFVARAVRVPFVARGRDWSGWDCWGLVLVAYRELRGVELPTYLDDYEAADLDWRRSTLGPVISAAARSWRRVDVPAPLDVVVLRVAGRPLHVGLTLGGGRVLHAEEGPGTVVERLSSPVWRGRIDGYYRRDG